jgi:hypothetical protein
MNTIKPTHHRNLNTGLFIVLIFLLSAILVNQTKINSAILVNQEKINENSLKQCEMKLLNKLVGTSPTHSEMAKKIRSEYPQD